MNKWTLLLVVDNIDFDSVRDLLNAGKNVMIGLCEKKGVSYSERTIPIEKEFKKECSFGKLKVVWLPDISEVVNACS